MSATQTEAEQPRIEVDKPIVQATPSRKRRRRAPATGAADDCFTCQERQTKCDRRRPYCTSCLDMGKDCSGYKTALTWGVGVASRGKLRGLSLPIASSKRAAQSGDNEEENRESPPQKLAKLSSTRRASDSKMVSPTEGTSACTPSTTSAATPTNYGFVNINPSSTSSTTTSPSFPPPSTQWKRPSSMSHARSMRLVDKKPRRHTLQPLQVSPMHPVRDYGVVPMTASVVGGYGHNDFGLSSQISPMVPAFSGYDLQAPTHREYSHPHSASYETAAFSGWHLPWSSAPHDASSVASDHSSQTAQEDVQGYFTNVEGMVPMQQDIMSQGPSITSAPSDATFMIDAKFQTAVTSASDLPPLVPDDVGDHLSLTTPRALLSTNVGNTPSLQFLIDYYDKVISPVIVAFDGPTNPYRAHILSLAVESETLQHALGALSSSNIRMRKSQNPLSTNRSLQCNDDSSHDHSVRKSSLALSLMDLKMESLPQSSIDEPSAEELYHKGQAIKLLNEQLADPARRKDDSILASLLILCLYHICDTGIAKFKTQFAGVKKILALRGGTKGCNSKATNWLTIMFTWFDAMTATVNDRESQLSGDNIDISRMNGDEWALENLAGCDGRLFETIAKLGRLNMLSQNKTVRPISPSSTPARRVSQPQSPSRQDYYSMNNTHIDSNGWSEIPTTTQAEDQDSRAQFWKEWTDIRHRLHEWQFDNSVIPTESMNPQGDRKDLLHISESFRYSALLYTERLAYPHLPSAHPNFQSLVTQALYNITNVKSDVFLLWPLFITGTECVSEQGRYLIRQRCLDIQKDSGFFNNISCLELLEKTWRDDSNEIDDRNEMQPLTGMGPEEYSGTGFKWRKAMDRVDGEYIVV